MIIKLKSYFEDVSHEFNGLSLSHQVESFCTLPLVRIVRVIGGICLIIILVGPVAAPQFTSYVDHFTIVSFSVKLLGLSTCLWTLFLSANKLYNGWLYLVNGD
jgi:hypothetical protein